MRTTLVNQCTANLSRSIANKLRATCIAAALTVMAVASVSAAPLLINGSLEGPVGKNTVPSPWSSIESSDTLDPTHNVGLPSSKTLFAATPSASPDGGTWVGIATGPSDFIESIYQTVSGFEIGTSYTLKWYHANFGYLDIDGHDYTPDANAIEVLADGLSIGHGSTLAVAPGWIEDSINFIATAADITLTFTSLDSSTFNYQSIDGIRLTETVPPSNAVPEPASLSLVAGAGLALLMASRRRKQAQQAA